MMISLNIVPMINHPAVHTKLYSPVRCETPAALTKHAERAAVSTWSNEHWNYCHKMLPKVTTGFGVVTNRLSQPNFRNAMINLYLLLRNLDTIEDDMAIPNEVKIPLLRNYHNCLYNKDWQFVCGRDAERELTKGHHHLHAAFMDLDSRCQEIIVDLTKRMGAGMAKFIPKEIETMRDYEEYSCTVHSTWVSTTLKLANVLIGEDLAPESHYDAVALFYQKMHTIHSYHEDINEIPKRKLYWPKEIWSKYGHKLEDFQEEVNSVKAVQLLNEMVTDVFSHAEDCLEFNSRIKDPFLFQYYAIPRVVSFANLALCYNNYEIFRTQTQLKPEVKARIFERTKTMGDMYGAFYDISCVLKSKVNKSDPHAAETLSILESIKQKCMDSGTLYQSKFGRKSVMFESIQDIM